MNGRQLPQADYLALKGASRELVTKVGGSVHAQRVTRVRQQAFSEYGSPDEMRFMPVDVVADLEAEVGPVVTRALATLSNCLLVPMPQGRGPGRVLEASGAAAEDTGKLMIELGQALRDGKITERERDALLRNIHQIMIDLSALAEAVKAEAITERSGEGKDD
ncbi:hypothetical protein XM25_15350 [Devosia sp. H5989]|nr:hypothetical protein XM25_15350 [Devosia sp. H5989]